jgi:transposase InsO family protein
VAVYAIHLSLAFPQFSGHDRLDAAIDTDGSPNIHAELRNEGTCVGRKRVARLMRQAHIRGVSRRRSFVVTTRRDMKQRPAPDLAGLLRRSTTAG